MGLLCRLDTPAGELVLLGTDEHLTGVHFTGGRHGPLEGFEPCPDAPPFVAACEQLRAYFAGSLREFDLPLAPLGTPFQRRVWAALQTVPYGTTRAYGVLARELGTGARAVGLTNGANPWSIVVPCHRLVAGDGGLVRYGGGLERKRFLLELERAR